MAPPLPWPAHWYTDYRDIRCIVPDCGFLTDVNTLLGQWTELHDHCAHTNGPEHSLLEIMLRQHKCALCDDSCFWGPEHLAFRMLYKHEKDTHGSAEMFNIDSFVVLARKRRIIFGSAGGQMAPDTNCQRLAFSRMMGKFQFILAAERLLLFEKSGFHVGEHSLSNLARILTYDSSAQPRDDVPHWSPVPPDRFLQFCRPHADDPADSSWRTVWRNLCEQYAAGRI